MSRDIRSFFTTLPKKTVVSSNINATSTRHDVGKSKKRSVTSLDSSSDDVILGTPEETKKSVKTKDTGRSKRRRIVEVSSDSETEHFSNKRTAVNKTQAETKTQVKVKQKNNSVTEKVKEKENKRSAVNPLKAFGDEPVKQSKVNKPVVKGTTELNIHGDDDFDKTLLELDEELLLRESEKATSQSKKEPAALLSPPPSVKKPVSSTPLKTTSTPQRQDETSSSSADQTRTPARKRKNSESEDCGMDPDQERHEKKRYTSMLYQKYLNRSGPAHLGTKWIPKGKSTCLKGLCFIITGVLDSLQRDDAQTLIVEHGGRCTQSVSGKVNYMVLGDDAGPAKVEKAQKLGTKTITEDELIELICNKSGINNQNKRSGDDNDDDDNSDNKQQQQQQQQSSRKTKVNDHHDDDDNDRVNKSHTKKQTSRNRSTEKLAIVKCEKISHNEHNNDDDDDNNKDIVDIPTVTKKQFTPMKEVISASKSKQTTATTTITIKKEPSDMRKRPVYDLAWVDKYKPSEVNQIIGQQGDKSNVRKLSNWLENWYRNHHNGKTKLNKPSPWAKNDDGAYFKSALLSGPPGVGKTTTATLVSKQLGFDVVEFNASDTRNKRMIHDEIASLLKSTSLVGYFTDGSAPSKRHVLLMDEVDGMSGNEDRGGIQELLALIKSTHVPVICMCNDRQHPKIRTLANYCYDLRFTKPRLEQIRGAMMSICYKEGMKIGVEALSQIIQGTGMDVRQTLNHLSMWNVPGVVTPPLTTELATSKAQASQKDVKLGPWEVIRKVFSAEEHRHMSLQDKSKLFFYDYSIGPLFVHENYVKVMPHCAKVDVLERFAAAADCISMGDVVDAKIRRTQNWSLLELQGMYASVLPGYYMAGHFAGQIDFPGWLGKNSKANKFQRMLSELYAHTRVRVSGNKHALNLDYLPYLRDAVVRPLVGQQGTAGIPAAVAAMTEYSLLREDLTNILELSHWPKTKDPFESGVDSKVKAAFTRAYNKQCTVLPYSNTGVNLKKKKKRGGGGAAATTVDDDDDEAAAEALTEGYGDVAEQSDGDENEDDDITVDAMIKAKKPTAAKTAKGESKASSSKGKAPAKPRGKKGTK